MGVSVGYHGLFRKRGSTIQGLGVELTKPGQPTSLTIGTLTSVTIAMSWTAPSTGGPSTDYVIFYRVTGTTPWLQSGNVGGTGTTYTALNLAVYTQYDFQVVPVNAVGFGTYSSTATGMTQHIPVPSAPTSLVASLSTDTTTQLNWIAPSTGITTDYLIQYRTTTGPGSWVTVSHAAQTTTFITVTGLTVATSYDFQVAGVNSSGNGAFSAISTLYTAPSWADSGTYWEVLTTTSSNTVWVAGTTYATIAAAITGTAISFVRASTKYVPTSTGALTTFTTNAVPMVDLGLSIEGGKTNYLLHSQSFNSSWSFNHITQVENVIAAPDGTTTAATFTGTGTNPYAVQSLNIGGSPYVMSFGVWLKVASGTLTVPISASGSDITGSPVSLNCSLTTAWQRFVVYPATTGTSGINYTIGGGGGFGSGNIIHVWGAQTEFDAVGEVLSTYIVTTSSSASRAADAFTIFPTPYTYNITITLNDSSTQTFASTVVTSAGYVLPIRSDGKYIVKVTGA